MIGHSGGAILGSERAKLSGAGVVGEEVDIGQLPGTLLADSRDAQPEFREITGVGLVLERVAPNLWSVMPRRVIFAYRPEQRFEPAMLHDFQARLRLDTGEASQHRVSPRVGHRFVPGVGLRPCTLRGRKWNIRSLTSMHQPDFCA